MYGLWTPVGSETLVECLRGENNLYKHTGTSFAFFTRAAIFTVGADAVVGHALALWCESSECSELWQRWSHSSPLEPEEKKRPAAVKNIFDENKNIFDESVKILILLNCNSWIHTFLIFYMMERKLYIKHLKDILKFILRKSVQLFEFWDELATSFMQHHFYVNDQLNIHRYLADVFSKITKWTCHFKKNKSQFFFNQWYNLSFHA